MFDDLLKKLLGLGSNVVNNVKKTASNIIQKPVQYFNPTSNNGNNFWSPSNKVSNFLVNSQKFTQNKKAPELVGNFFRNTAKTQAPAFKSKIARKAINFAGDLSGNVAQTFVSGTLQAGNNLPEMFNKNNSKLKKAEALAKVAVGGAKIASLAQPFFHGTNMVASVPRDNIKDKDLPRRLASGIMKGVTGEEGMATNVPDIKTKLGFLGEADIAKSVGEMYGFVKNPLWKKMSPITSLVTKAKVINNPFFNYVVTRGLKGGVEGMIQGFGNVPDGLTEKQKSEYVMKNLLMGAGSEIVMDKSMELAQKGFKRIMTGPEVQKTLAGTFDNLKRFHNTAGKYAKYPGLKTKDYDFINKFETNNTNDKGVWVERPDGSGADLVGGPKSVDFGKNLEKYNYLLEKGSQNKLDQQSGAINFNAKVGIPNKKLSSSNSSKFDQELPQLKSKELKVEKTTDIPTLNNNTNLEVKSKVPKSAETIIQEQLSGASPKNVEQFSDKYPKQTPQLQLDKTNKVNTQNQLPLDSPNSAYDSIIQDGKKQIGSLADEPKKSISQHLDEFYTDWVDRYNPVTKLTKVAEGSQKKIGAEIRPEYNPKYIIRRFLGMGGIAEERFQNKLMPIVKELDNQGVKKGDLDLYLKSRRDINLSSRGIKGTSSEEATKYTTALEGKYGDKIKNIADKLYSYQDEGLQDLADAGFLSPESKKIIQEKNIDYVPFQRVMDEVDEFLGMPSKVAQQSVNPVKKMGGSDKKVYSPLESIVLNTYKQRAAIEKNNVAKSVVGLQKFIPDLKFEKTKTLGNDSIAVWENGVKSYYKVGEDIAKSMRGMNEETMNSWSKILTAPAALLRQGATGRNPDFMFPNIVRDQLDAAVNSKYGYVPFVDYFRGLAHVAKNDEIVSLWMKSGGAQSFSSLTGRKSVQEMFNEKKSKKNLFNWLAAGLDKMGKYSEIPTRVGLFSKAYKKTGNATLAAYESREGTMDFSRMGAKMKVANSIIPFLNVGVQGFDKIIRNAKEDPSKFAAKMALYGILPTVMTTVYNVVTHPEEYSEIPQHVKDSNFIFVSGRNDKGTVDYVSIPKGNVITLISNPVENFVSYLANTNQQSFGEFATSFLSSSLPVVGDGQSLGEVATKTIGSNLPQAIKPITENLMNKSFFKYNTKTEESKEIVPYYLKNKAPGDQSYEFTPSMYKVIGKIIKVSPLKVQNLMEGYLAGYTKIPANIIEGLKNISEGKEVNKNQTPIIRRFIQETYPTTKTTPKKTTEATPLIPQANAAEDSGFFGSIFKPNERKSKAEEKAVDYFLNEKSNKVDIQSLPEKTKYEKAVKEKTAFKIVDDIIDSTDLNDNQKALAFQKIGIKKEDAEYYLVAKKSVDERYAYVQDLMESNSGDIKSLVPLRKTINGQKILSDSVITAMVDDEMISKADGKTLKKIKDETGAVKAGSGSGTKGGITKTKLKTFKSKVNSAYKQFYSSRAKSTKLPELNFNFFNSSSKKKSSNKTIKISKLQQADVKLNNSVKPVPIEQLFKNPSIQTANLSKAKALVYSSKGGGSNGKKLKLSKSSIRSLNKK